MMRTIVVMPGDGIGRVVVPEAQRVLDAAGFRADWVHADIGWESWCREGNALPDRTLSLLERHGVALFGAITSKPRAEADADLAPELRGRGLRYESPVLAMRRRLGLEIALRPCVSLPGNPVSYVRRTAAGLEEPRIDVELVIQNTECLYAGVEWSGLPEPLRAQLDRHPNMRAFGGAPSEELAVSARVVSRAASLRVAGAAFARAASRGARSVTIVDKWGVMAATGAMLLEAAEEVAARHPQIALRRANADAAMLWITRRPETFGVVLASAFIGDVLSDGFAGLVGGMGFAPCANLGSRCAVFEPSHGSAPRYADLEPSIVNPIATILAAAMLLDHVGELERAARVRAAVARVVEEGRVRTYDMLGLHGSPEVLAQGAASTRAMTDAIIAALRG